MKNSIKLLAIVLLISSGFISCKKDDDSATPSTSAYFTQGKWRVTFYNDSGNNETHHFNDYVFTFNSGGTVTATQSGGATVTGTWSSGFDDNQNKLYLTFTTNNNFIEISDDWLIIQQSSAKIQLQDVSGGNGGTDLLTFEKI
jgi:hypothetical protein